MNIELIGNRALLGALLCLVLGCGDPDKKPKLEAGCPSTDAAIEGDGQKLTALSLGPSNACGVVNDGTLLCWGGSSDLHSPSLVLGMEQISAVSVGSIETCAIGPGGSVTCFGKFQDTAAVPRLCGATALAVGVGPRCAVVNDGSVRCWGSLQEAVFGTASSETAVTVPGVSDATTVAMGTSGYACALISDGTVTCWGGGPRSADRPGIEPTLVPEISGAVTLAATEAGTLDMCAVLDDGSVTCWSHAVAPETVRGVEGVVSVGHGSSHYCVALDDGTASCWGANQNGQLGNGTNAQSDDPVPVKDLSGVTAVAAAGIGSSDGYSCALLDDGSARCWGSNAMGQLGYPVPDDSNVPVEVLFP